MSSNVAVSLTYRTESTTYQDQHNYLGIVDANLVGSTSSLTLARILFISPNNSESVQNWNGYSVDPVNRFH